MRWPGSELIARWKTLASPTSTISSSPKSPWSRNLVMIIALSVSDSIVLLMSDKNILTRSRPSFKNRKIWGSRTRHSSHRYARQEMHNNWRSVTKILRFRRRSSRFSISHRAYRSFNWWFHLSRAFLRPKTKLRVKLSLWNSKWRTAGCRSRSSGLS